MVRNRIVLISLILLLFLIYFRPDPIPLNSDDLWVFNIVEDMVSEPSYYSLSGSGYRLMHKLLYLPLFWFFNFELIKLNFPTMLLSVLFSMGLVISSYLLTKKIFNEEAAILNALLVGVSNTIIMTIWYWSANHVIIGTMFALICLHLLLGKNFGTASIFIFMAIFTRETFNISLLLVSLYALFSSSIKRTLKNSIILLWPFALYVGYMLLNNIFLGNVLNPTFSAFVGFSLNEILLKEYLIYFHKAMLTPLIIFTLIILLLYKKYFFLNMLSNKKIFLFLYSLGGIITIFLTKNVDPRYLIPIIPIMFMVISIIFSNILKQINCCRLMYIIVFANLLMGILIFNVTNFSIVLGDLYFISILFNFLFYLIILICIIFPTYNYLKSKRYLIKHIIVIIFFLFLSITILTQSLWSYTFYVHQYDHTTIPNQMMNFIKDLPDNSTLFFNPSNSITSPDKDWLKAFNIEKNISLKYDLLLINQTINSKKNIYFVSEPGGALINKDIIGDIVKQNETKFQKVVELGSDYKKYLAVRINKNIIYAIKDFLNTGLLFTVYNKEGYKMHIYKYENN